MPHRWQPLCDASEAPVVAKTWAMQSKFDLPVETSRILESQPSRVLFPGDNKAETTVSVVIRFCMERTRRVGRYPRKQDRYKAPKNNRIGSRWPIGRGARATVLWFEGISGLVQVFTALVIIAARYGRNEKMQWKDKTTFSALSEGFV